LFDCVVSNDMRVALLVSLLILSGCFVRPRSSDILGQYESSTGDSVLILNSSDDPEHGNFTLFMPSDTMRGKWSIYWYPKASDERWPERFTKIGFESPPFGNYYVAFEGLRVVIYSGMTTELFSK